MAELLAEGLIPKAFNWPVIRLCGPAGQVATTEEREKDLGELQLTVKKEGKNLIPFLWDVVTLLHSMWKGGSSEEKMAVVKKVATERFRWMSLAPRFRLLSHAALTGEQQFAERPLERVAWGLGSCPGLSSFTKKLFIAHDCQGHSVGGDSEYLTLWPFLLRKLIS